MNLDEEAPGLARPLHGPATAADRRVERLFEIAIVFVVGISLIGLAATLLGVFHAPQVLVASLLVTGVYTHWTRASNGLPGPAPRWRHVVLLLLVALLFRVPAYHYVLGGQDEGVYVNIAHYIDDTGGISVHDTVKRQLRDTPYLASYLADNHIGGSFVAGVYNRGTHNNKLEFQFYHVFPAWMALFDGIFGARYGVYALTFLALVSVLLFYQLALSLTGSYRAALTAGGLLALNPLHAFFSKFPVTEVPTLCFALAGFTLLAGYWSAGHLHRQGRWLVLSVLAFFCVFTTRISGFMYVPFFVGLAWVALLYDRDDQRCKMMQRWAAGVVVAYLVSIAYGLIWSHAYAHDIYRLSFRPLLGQHWKLLLLLIIFLALLSWLALGAVRKWKDEWRRKWASRVGSLLDRGPFVVVLVALLLGLVKIYRLGWSDRYLHDPSLGGRWHLAGTGWQAASATSLWALIVFMGPLLVLLLVVLIARTCADPRLGFLRWFLAGFFAYATLLQWVIPYSPYYARYMVSEVVPYTVLFVTCAWSALRPSMAKTSITLAIALSAVYATVLSAAQIGKNENDGAYSALARLTTRIDPSDLILLYAPPDPDINQSELKTPLLYTFHLNVVTVGSAALADQAYLAKLDTLYDDVFLVSTRSHASSEFEHMDDTRFAVKSFAWNHSFPRSLVTSRNVLLNLYLMKHVRPPAGSVVGFASDGSGVDWLRTGWSAPERWGVWSLGNQAVLSIDPRSLPESTSPLALNVHANVFVSSAHPMQRIGVTVNGKRAAEYTVRYPSSRLAMQIPLGRYDSSASAHVQIEFSLPDAVSPQSVGVNNDSRVVALGLIDAQVTPVGARKIAPTPATASSR